MIDTKTSSDSLIEAPAAPKRSRLQEAWRLLKKNKLAFAGLTIFVLFFLVALLGLALTSGTGPFFDPSLVRLPEKLRPPLSMPNLDVLQPEEVPRLGIYFFGTDDLGRDVFARMLQGAWVSLTVGFVAVGISLIIGVIMGGISGYYGLRLVSLVDVSFALFVLIGGSFSWQQDQRLSDRFFFSSACFSSSPPLCQKPSCARAPRRSGPFSCAKGSSPSIQ